MAQQSNKSATTQGDQITSKGLMREEENASSSQDEDDYDAEGEESPPISPPQQSPDLQQWGDPGLFLHQLTDYERVSHFLDELHDFNHLEWSLALPYDDPQPIHSTCGDDTCVSFVDDSLVDESLFAL